MNELEEKSHALFLAHKGGSKEILDDIPKTLAECIDMLKILLKRSEEHDARIEYLGDILRRHKLSWRKNYIRIEM